LEDASPKRLKHSIAERARQKRKAPQKRGLPHINQPHDAIYHNWFSPFLWSQIVIAGKAAGWKMSASEIHNILQQKDPTVFAKISRTTINGWIDRSGQSPDGQTRHFGWQRMEITSFIPTLVTVVH
jgi:hypothetical protein